MQYNTIRSQLNMLIKISLLTCRHIGESFPVNIIVKLYKCILNKIDSQYSHWQTNLNENFHDSLECVYTDLKYSEKYVKQKV